MQSAGNFNNPTMQSGVDKNMLEDFNNNKNLLLNDEDFGYYLAGLIEADGSFEKNKNFI